MSDRGMKKWNAYKTLPEHDPAIRNRIKERDKIAKPKISNEEAEAINEILVNYSGEEVVLGYYRKGEIFTITTTIKKIDAFNRKLITINEERISFSELISLKRKK